MSQMIEGPRKTYLAAAGIGAHLRVKITDGSTKPPTVNVAGASDPSVGVTEAYQAAAGPIAILLVNAQGTRKMHATGAITSGNPVYAAAAGKVASSGTVVEGYAQETTTATGDIFEVLPSHNSDISTAIAGTTAAAFEVDNDASTPKIALTGQSGGSGDFTTTLKPEAALAGDTSIIVPEVDGTLAALELAQTFTARQGLTGNVANTAGVGITGTADNYVTSVEKIGSIIKTTILIEVDGLNSGGTADDVIGAQGAGVAHLGQITAAVNGTIFAGKITCLETPTGGDPDIDLWYTDDATGVEDTLISAMGNQVQTIDHGDWTGAEVDVLTAFPAADKYLYLGGGQVTDATYTAGILLIELFGVAP